MNQDISNNMGNSQQTNVAPNSSLGLLAENSTQLWWLGCILTPILAAQLLFQTGLLPINVARVVGRLFFIPFLPFTMITTRWRGNWWDKVDEKVFLGAVPLTLIGHVDALYKLGVRAVINLCDEYAGPISLYEKKGIKQLYLPTVDHFEPSIEDLEKSVQFINEVTSKGDSVYIHCKAGHGRSAAVVFCWLIVSKKFTMEQAQDYLNRRRAVRRKLLKQKNLIAFYSKYASS